MPHRDDFERVCMYPTLQTTGCVPVSVSECCSQEYDNGLEEVISEITVGADEEEVERELKLAHVDIYNKGLIEREKRKRCALSIDSSDCVFKCVSFAVLPSSMDLLLGSRD